MKSLANAVIACKNKGQDDSKQGMALLLITDQASSLEVTDVVIVLKDDTTA